MMDITYFTDTEYRLVLQALHREREVCEKVEHESKEANADRRLTSMMADIERKIQYIQYHYRDGSISAGTDYEKQEDETLKELKLEKGNTQGCENQDIVKKIRTDMESIKENWTSKKSEGILGAPFVDKACAIPDAAFVSEFMHVRPSSVKDVEALIRSGLISGTCYDCTDNQGLNEAWLYQMNDETYDIELSHWCETPFEQQAAEQIFQLYQKKHNEDNQQKKEAIQHTRRPRLEGCPDYPRFQAAFSELLLDCFEKELDEYCRMGDVSESYIENAPRIVCWFEGMIPTEDLIEEFSE